jgi:DNA-binding MarR family transcriptional regulator
VASKRQALEAELGAAVRAFQRATDEVDEVVSRLMGINRTDARVLDVLEEHGRMTAGEVAGRTGLTSGAVTGVLDRLERAGYVERVRDDADRRRVFVEPTERARAAAAELYGPLAAAGAPLLARMSERELTRFVAFLRDANEITTAHAARLREREDDS